MKPTLSEIVRALHLQPLSEEGGLFAETYRSSDIIDARQFGRGHSSPRSLCTAIYYLLTPTSFSAIHKLPGDEVFHFYLGDPVEMLELHTDGSSRTIILGPDVLNGMRLQHVVAGNVWQGSRLVRGGEYALLGTTMSPGFDYADFVIGNMRDLVAKYPDRATLISELLRE
jgi:predicted cupin superfamily sugar epimerase